MNKTILKWFRQMFSHNKRYYFAKDIVGVRSELSEVSTSAFLHAELTNSIHKDVVVLIVSNDFVADPSLIMSHFKHNYDFTVDEFVMLAYKLGTTTKVYIENPILLLKDAIKLNDVFAKDTLKQFRQLLNQQVTYNDDVFKRKYDEFRIKLEKDRQQSKLKAEDIDADKKIDEWLNKNKKS